MGLSVRDLPAMRALTQEPIVDNGLSCWLFARPSGLAVRSGFSPWLFAGASLPRHDEWNDGRVLHVSYVADLSNLQAPTRESLDNLSFAPQG